jgi:hypothetical protein
VADEITTSVGNKLIRVEDPEQNTAFDRIKVNIFELFFTLLTLRTFASVVVYSESTTMLA